MPLICDKVTLSQTPSLVFDARPHPASDRVVRSYWPASDITLLGLQHDVSGSQVVVERKRPGQRGIPALLIFKDCKVAEQIVGFVPKDTIDKSVIKGLA
jgi:hypothetical protein